MSNRQRKLGFVMLLLVVAAGASVGVLAFHAGPHGAAQEQAKPGAPSEVAVTVEPVTPRAVQRRVQFVGTLYGHDEVAISTKVGGRVVRVAHDIGDVVHPGDVLLEIDDTDFRLAVTEAERSLELDLSKLGLQTPPQANFDIDQLPSVVRAQLLEKNAQSRLARMQSLNAQNSVSRDNLDQVETEYRVAQANTRQALLDAEQTLAAIRHKQALLETAQQRLRDTRVVVPQPSTLPAQPGGVALASASSVSSTSASGSAASSDASSSVSYTVAERMVTEGEMVNLTPPSPVFRLVMDQPLKFKATAPERFIGDLKIGQRTELRVEAYPGEMFYGVVARINPTIDRANRTFQIEVHVPNEDLRLRPGSFAKAAVLTREDPAAPTVPEESLVRFAGVVKVFVIREGRAKEIPVQLGVRLQTTEDGQVRHWVEVLGDLHSGESVVTTGHSQLSADTPVRIRQ
jgi:multidrug efflux pump subunit AcrA (membrane-fusion protein)